MAMTPESLARIPKIAYPATTRSPAIMAVPTSFLD
jgi:hypothetical protein